MTNNQTLFEFYEGLSKKPHIETGTEELKESVMLDEEFGSRIKKLDRRLQQYVSRVNRLEDNSLLNKIYCTTSKIYNALRDVKEKPLSEEFNEIAKESTETLSQFERGLSIYESQIMKMDDFRKRKIAEISDYVCMRDEVLVEDCGNNELLEEITAKIESIKTPGGLSIDEIKYSDAKANLGFRIIDNKAKRTLLTSLIGHKIEFKNMAERDIEENTNILYWLRGAYDKFKHSVALLQEIMANKLTAD